MTHNIYFCKDDVPVMWAHVPRNDVTQIKAHGGILAKYAGSIKRHKINTIYIHNVFGWARIALIYDAAKKDLVWLYTAAPSTTKIREVYDWEERKNDCQRQS